MGSLVLDLQRDALDTSVELLTLLRKSLVVARKLNIQEFQLWIQSELNGYSRESKLPQYRFVYGELKCHNPINGWIPVIIDPKLHEIISKVPIFQPISQLELLLRERQSLTIMPPGLDNLLRKYDDVPYEMAIHIDQSQVYRFLESVRNIVLEWSLKLEENGIFGEGMTFSPEEKEAAAKYDYHSSIPIINITVNQMQESSSESQASLEGFNNDLRNARIANFANQVKDNARQQANQYNYSLEQQRNLNEAAAEIQGILEQLSTTHSTETVSGRMQLATAAVTRIENDSSLMKRTISALQAGGVSALEQLLNHPAASFVIAALEDWKKTKGV
jgi:hypothetical protein